MGVSTLDDDNAVSPARPRAGEAVADLARAFAALVAAFADMAPATRERLVSGRIRAKMSLLLWPGEKLRVPASREAQMG